MKVEPDAKITVFAVPVLPKMFPAPPVPCVKTEPELNVIPLASVTDSGCGAPEVLIEPVTEPVAPAGSFRTVGVVELIVRVPDGISKPGPLPVIVIIGALLKVVPAVIVPDSLAPTRRTTSDRIARAAAHLLARS